MTFLHAGKVLLSLPGAEIQQACLSASVIEANEELPGSLSEELRSALRLICDVCIRYGGTVKCVVRPEMFTHGASRDWMRSRVGDDFEHICLSDGTTIKHLPGFPTHVFFYGLSRQTSLQALHKLVVRAPELVAGVSSQLNSCFALGNGSIRAGSKPTILHREHPAPSAGVELWTFFFNRHSVADCLARTKQHGPVTVEQAEPTNLLYVVLTDAALADRAFARAVAALVLQISQTPSALLVLRLPVGNDETDALASGTAILLAALSETDIVLPRARLNNVMMTARDLAEDHPLFDRAPLHIIVHEYFDFWRHTPRFYRRAARITVLGGPQTSRFPALPYDVSAIYGPNAVRRWIEAS